MSADVLGVVDARSSSSVTRRGSATRPPRLPELGGHHLHHLETLDALGMARRRQMVGKARGGEDRERHSRELYLAGTTPMEPPADFNGPISHR